LPIYSTDPVRASVRWMHSPASTSAPPTASSRKPTTPMPTSKANTTPPTTPAFQPFLFGSGGGDSHWGSSPVPCSCPGDCVPRSICPSQPAIGYPGCCGGLVIIPFRSACGRPAFNQVHHPGNNSPENRERFG